MTINVKSTIFFESKDAEGWSESWYTTSADINSAQGSLDTIIPLRAAMLGSTSNIIYARVSDVMVKGDSLLTTVSMPVVGTYAGGGADPLEANTALLVEIFASSTKKNRIFVRGLLIDTVVGREYKAPSLFVTAANAWAAGMIAAAIAVRHRTAVGPPPMYSYTAASSMYVVKATARKPGRPFGLPVGRRK